MYNRQITQTVLDAWQSLDWNRRSPLERDINQYWTTPTHHAMHNQLPTRMTTLQNELSPTKRKREFELSVDMYTAHNEKKRIVSAFNLSDNVFDITLRSGPDTYVMRPPSKKGVDGKIPVIKCIHEVTKESDENRKASPGTCSFCLTEPTDCVFLP